VEKTEKAKKKPKPYFSWDWGYGKMILFPFAQASSFFTVTFFQNQRTTTTIFSKVRPNFLLSVSKFALSTPFFLTTFHSNNIIEVCPCSERAPLFYNPVTVSQNRS
jgi:hypothetical protein